MFKAELIRNKGPWRGIDDVEVAVAEYIDSFNHHRLHGEIGHLPPAELEGAHTPRTSATDGWNQITEPLKRGLDTSLSAAS